MNKRVAFRNVYTKEVTTNFPQPRPEGPRDLYRCSPRLIFAGAVALMAAGCVQPYAPTGPYHLGRPIGSSRPLATQDQTARIEEQDRINRFRRLATIQGVMQPTVEALLLPPGSTSFMAGPVPVVRVVFPERAFFAFDSAEPLPASQPILDLIAEDMKRDVPDAAMTILGHTDAVGSDAYNIDLSRRRAAAVMAALIARGVNPNQLSEVAIGKRQPMAPNDTPEGRALNRRVEFLISPGVSANLAAVQQRVIPSSFFDIRQPDMVKPRPYADDEPLRPLNRDYSLRSPENDVVPAPLSSGDSPPRTTKDPEPLSLTPDPVTRRLPSVAQVYRPAETGDGISKKSNLTLQPLGGLPLSPVAPAGPTEFRAVGTTVKQQAAATELAPTMPVAPIQLIPPDEITPRSVDPSGPDHF